MPGELQPISDNWSTVLAVAAHPDDLEYGAVAAVAKWAAAGKRISYCVATRGEAGIDAIAPEEAGPLREKEERAAAAVVGVEVVEFLGHPDGVLEYGLPLRRDLARAIRRHRPDAVLTTNFRPTAMNGALNQADHVALGLALLDAVRDAGNRWVFRELLDEGWEPWGGVHHVVAVGSPASTHGIDVGEHVETGLASLREHATYIAGLRGGDASFEEVSGVIRTRTAAAGRRLGCDYALPVELLQL